MTMTSLQAPAAASTWCGSPCMVRHSHAALRRDSRSAIRARKLAACSCSASIWVWMACTGTESAYSIAAAGTRSGYTTISLASCSSPRSAANAKRALMWLSASA
jgi:hypothetical protein